MPNQQSDVRSRADLAKLFKKLCDVDRRAAAVSADESRDSLPDVVLRGAVIEQPAIGVTVEIDEPRSDDFARRVDLVEGSCLRHAADDGDAAVSNDDVTFVRWPAGAIDDGAARNEDVKSLVASLDWLRGSWQKRWVEWQVEIEDPLRVGLRVDFIFGQVKTIAKNRSLHNRAIGPR